MQRNHRQFHARIWLVLLVALPSIVVISLLIRNRLPLKAPAILLKPPASEVQK